MNKPKVRFKGYTDAWEQRKLNEIAEKVTEKNRDNLYDEPFTNSAEQGIISQKDYFDREVVNEENLDGYYVVRDDDFVYNPRVSVSAPVGPINRNKLGRNGVMSPLYTVFRTHDINTTYLEHYFKTQHWHMYMKMNGDSGARFDRFSIATLLFMEMPIPYPSVGEQVKIGAYFDSLDTLITLHQRKCEETKMLKKFMLQKMFPKDGESVPEIRFSGFTDAWEQRKVSELCSISTGKSNTQDNVEDGEYPFYVRSPIIERSNKYLYDEEAVLTVGDGAGTGKVFHYVNGKYDLHQRVYRMYDFSDELYSKYFYHYFSKNFYRRVMAMTAKTSVDSVRLEMIADMDIVVPIREEQEKIGQYFDDIDSLITLHQRKCEELQNIKKFMLQNMFAS